MVVIHHYQFPADPHQADQAEWMENKDLSSLLTWEEIRKVLKWCKKRFY